MKNKHKLILFGLAYLIKFAFSLFIIPVLISFLITSVIFSLYVFMLYKRSKLINYIPIIILDYCLVFYFTFNMYGFNVSSVFISIFDFCLINGFLYYLLINELGKLSKKRLSFLSNLEVDKGISLLENDNYQEAIKAFNKAIKEHKQNYLGYMGMCNTLQKMNKTNRRSFKYYRNKCIKYAPEELKSSIIDKYK